MKLLILWAFFCFQSFMGVQSSYQGIPQLWEIHAPHSHPVLLDLESDGTIDIWSSQGNSSRVMVESSEGLRVIRALDKFNIDYKVVADDLVRLIDEEAKYLKKSRRKRAVNQMDWTSYHRLEDIEGYLTWLNTSHPNLVTVFPVAITEEGRPVYVVKVENRRSLHPKRKIWIEGGIHAREWISPAATTFLLHQVVTSPEFAPILERSIWYFVPVSNPDGYAYTFEGGKARLWRKNRKRVSVLLPNRCRGIDLNRNWDLKWGVGASSNPCSDTYKGSEPFSEPETDGLRRVMQLEGPINVFITFHSYGQAVLYPWGWTNDPPANVGSLWHLGKLFVDAVNHASKGKTSYTLGGSAEVYGFASGASDDWSFGVLQSPYSYTIELRDNGRHGFLLPENQILDSVQETTVGIYCMISFLTEVGACAKPIDRNDIVDKEESSTNRQNEVVFNE